MAKEGKLVDPVADGQKERDQQEQGAEIKVLSMEALDLEDFKPVPISAARQPHPFEGYPQKKIKIGTYIERGKEFDLIVNASAIVALNPKEYVHQDPSGKGITINVKGVEKTVDYATSHSRIVRSETGQNLVIVFDREIVLAGGKKMSRATLCPDPTARSQLVYTINKKTGKIEVDRRYVLADIDQVGRLRRLFEMFNYQQTQSERLAQKFDEESESKAE